MSAGFLLRERAQDLAVAVVAQLGVGRLDAAASARRRPRRAGRKAPSRGASPSSGRPSACPSDPCSGSRAARGRARSGDRFPPRPRGARPPRGSRRGGACPSAASSRRSAAGGRAEPRGSSVAVAPVHDAAGRLHGARAQLQAFFPLFSSASQASGKAARASRRRTRSRSISLPAGQVGLRAARPAQEVSDPLLGDHGILMLADHVLKTLRVLHESPRRLADRSLGQLGGVARPLAADPHGVQLVVGRVGRQRLHGLAELAELGGRDVRQRDVGLARTRRGRGRLETVEELVVARLRHRLEHRCARRGPARRRATGETVRRPGARPARARRSPRAAAP